MHILYNYRRCPYAMRARMALMQADIQVEIREISFRNKPQQMLDASPKGTVPVLITEDNQVIDESLDIMCWALQQNDPNNWLANQALSLELISQNDTQFKPQLDAYKYPERQDIADPELAKQNGEKFLQVLEDRLNNTVFLCSDDIQLADIAIVPFIRQFANVDSLWFEKSHYTKLRNWLYHLLDSELFTKIMQRFHEWQPGSAPQLLIK